MGSISRPTPTKPRTNYSAYPDLASQIQSFISLPPPNLQPSETIFIISVGFWDVYDFAQLDYAAAQNATDTSIDYMFDQLDVLYTHSATKLYPANDTMLEDASTTSNTTARDKFKVIIPRIFDPTLLPGWILQRPAPARPARIAEQQKNAVYLVQRWNLGVENRMGAWVERNVNISTTRFEPEPSSETIKALPISKTDVREDDTEGQTLDGHFEPFGTDSNASRKRGAKKHESENLPKKGIFYHDSASLILDLILENQLEDEEISDASGLGKGESPFENVYVPCLRALDVDEDVTTSIKDGWKESNGMLLCKEPELYMWLDAWDLGSKGKKMIGQSIGQIFQERKSVRSKMENKGKSL